MIGCIALLLISTFPSTFSIIASVAPDFALGTDDAKAYVAY